MSKAQTEVKASSYYNRISPYKLRIVADLIRGKMAGQAVDILKNIPQGGARIILKVLNSAVANAVHNNKYDSGSLKLETIIINEGPKLKRIKPRSRGRAFQILKRTSHVHVSLKKI